MAIFTPTRHLTWLEFFLALFAALTLIWLAQGLSPPSLAYGRNAIYQNAVWPSQAAQALWLQTHVGSLMAVVIGGGALVLHLARLAIPPCGFLCGAMAIWFAVLGMVQTMLPDAPAWQWLGINIGFVASLVTLTIWPLVTRGCKKLVPHLPPPQKQTLRCLWHYPVFALLTGIGVLIWLDYAARGPSMFHLVGVRQLYYWLGAVATYTLAAGLRLLLLSTLAWVLSRVDHVSAHPLQACMKVLRILQARVLSRIGPRLTFHMALCIATVLLFVAWMVGVAYVGHADKKLSATTS